ncbi:iron-siderophore ABC transporter substrate-binding protein [Paenibacillus aurantius]|uniref:Iron-siderophore ABC transporter substrate-binding protein n=1 Tax=Paenibacillus aurantius TaxID=2918900 RepID=A0AA96RDZ6_9BACL|nr:iron-siderophore ABC transporter substrate-binding protein [Paenibacillus aurantius]WNQ11905.1 iron-siderophore ABC transporter substrate-binding protein [Paenibacillus aurantius]
MLSRRHLSRRFRALPLLSAVVSLSVWLTACGSPAADSTPSPSSPAASGAPAASGTHKVKHAMGETEVPNSPQRVVILTNEGTEALLALGVKPVGAVNSYVGNPYYDHIKAEMEGVKPLGTESQPNLEMIAALKPDLILGNKMRQEKIYTQLNAIAPTVFSETLRGEWKNNFRLYAEALNKKDAGEKVIGDFDKRIEDFKSKAGDKLKEQVSVVRFMAGKTRVYLEDSFTGVIFKQIGIARKPNNYKDPFMEEITKERLPEVDAQRLFYFTYETGDNKGTQQEKDWLNDPLWKNLNVVKSGKVYRVNDTIWNTAGGVKAANLMLDELYKIYEVK